VQPLKNFTNNKLKTTWEEDTMVYIRESEFARREAGIIMAIQTWQSFTWADNE
jgi:hypothetical protein